MTVVKVTAGDPVQFKNVDSDLQHTVGFLGVCDGYTRSLTVNVYWSCHHGFASRHSYRLGKLYQGYARPGQMSRHIGLFLSLAPKGYGSKSEDFMRKYLFGLVMFGVALMAVELSLGIAAQANSSPSPCGKNLIVNGSFEQSPDPGSWRTLQAGSTDLEGWTVTHGSVDVVGYLWKASDGSRSIDLDGVSFGGISQTFDTVAGKRYFVTFDFAGNGHGAPIVKKMQVTAADQSAEFQYDERDWQRLGWEVESFSFVAKAASTTLSFNSLDTENGYFGPVIDNVRVQTACE